MPVHHREQGSSKGLFILLAILCSYASTAQVSLTGPSCVLPDVEYHYYIFGQYDSASTMKVCASQGKILASGSTCYQGAPVRMIRVIWKKHLDKATLSLSTPKGDTSLRINETSPITGGIIDTLTHIMQLTVGDTLHTIRCSSPQGGGCSVDYIYQWQSSEDGVLWQDMAGGDSEQLAGPLLLSKTTYLRRKVIDKASNTTNFSNTATVLVKPANLQP